MYVTLEPCAHRGRTPPCVDAVLDAGLRRLVIGMQDPDPRTLGKSLTRLRRGGLEVRIGVEEEACRELNRGFISRVERGRPFTELKLAASLDGRIATATGESRWITGERSRRFVHRLRRQVGAIGVGSGTVLADDPELTARRGERVVHTPRRIVIDSALRTPASARLIDASDPERCWILCSNGASERRRRRLERAGARVIPVASRAGHLDLRKAWKTLGNEGVNALLVEGGAGLGAALLRAGLVDRLYLMLAPLLIGGDGRAVLETLGVRRLSSAPVAEKLTLRRLGNDLLLIAEW